MPIVPNQSTSSWGNPSIWAGRKAQWRGWGGCSGSILWRAHIIHSHLDLTKETQPVSVLNPLPFFFSSATSDCSPFLFVFIFILLPFLSLLFCFFSSLRCDCQRVSWHAGWLARGGFFQRRLFTRRRLRMIDSWLVKACSCSGCRMTGA